MFASSAFADQKNIRKILSLQEKMENEHDDLDFWVDQGKGKIHEFFTDGDDEEGEEFRITKGSKDILLTEYSKVVKRLPKKFHICRLYAALKDSSGKLDKNRLDKLKNEAEEIERSMS